VTPEQPCCGAFARNGDPNNAAIGRPWPPSPAKLIVDATPTQAVITTQ
jgi:para-nitrobenzyl esterase